MLVIATAGHVDHGKSTLVRALTGTDPDRLSQEKRRGLTLDLGYAWAPLPSGGEVAFVDVPGHGDYLSNALAGWGPAPAALLVVAADEGWRAQTRQHLAAMVALGIGQVVVAVTRADLADPADAVAETTRALAPTTWSAAAIVAVSATTGAGLADLLDAIAELDQSASSPPTPTRLWVDRVFTLAGIGTVATGTLVGGALHVGDTLQLRDGRGRIRGLQCLGEPVVGVEAVARVAVNVRGVAVSEIARGEALVPVDSPLSPSRRLVVARTPGGRRWPRHVLLSVGSRTIAAEITAPDRIVLAEPLVLAAGDRGVVRDSSARVILGGLTVLDPHPPTRSRPRRDSLSPPGRDPVSPRGRDSLSPPGRDPVNPGGRDPVNPRGRDPVNLPARPAAAAPGERARHTGSEALAARLAANPLDSPNAAQLAAWGLDRTALGAGAAARWWLRLTGGLLVGPDAAAWTLARLPDLPQPVTVSAARAAWGTSRRVALAVLAHLDGQRLTRRLGDDRRELTTAGLALLAAVNAAPGPVASVRTAPGPVASVRTAPGPVASVRIAPGPTDRGAPLDITTVDPSARAD